ncbi:hypothetical protein CWO85_02730 [Candidatus Phytoplasma ziziphi]|uniref:AAA+ ATPase domain-containing protein n=2 Tax=Candidatus Phytoplasma TaxID=33926 RepID=A0A660HMY4_ZIZJU|nr:AAA family ATPase [Candidatus Phytoplasma ziziphi]AYJ01403.1 hypothetical protein CWO85_02730 [Candidatus Phytoplasma ziziphi]
MNRKRIHRKNLFFILSIVLFLYFTLNNIRGNGDNITIPQEIIEQQEFFYYLNIQYNINKTQENNRLIRTYFIDQMKTKKQREFIYEKNNDEIKCSSRFYNTDQDQENTIKWDAFNTYDQTYNDKGKILTSRAYTSENTIKWDSFNTYDITYDDEGNILTSRDYTSENTIKWDAFNTYNRTYNDKGNILTSRAYTSEGTIKWDHFNTYNRTYNDKGNILTSRAYTSEGTIKWDSFDTYDKTYDNEGNILTSRAYTSEGTIKWDHFNTYNRTYDNQGRILTSRAYTSEGTIKWDSFITYDITYDDESKILTSRAYTSEGTIKWDSFNTYDRTYNDKGNILTSRAYTSEGTIKWDSFNTYDRTYDNQGRILTSRAYTSEGTIKWDSFITYDRTYDNQGNILTSRAYTSEGTIKWDSFDTYDKTYDNEGRILTKTVYFSENWKIIWNKNSDIIKIMITSQISDEIEPNYTNSKDRINQIYESTKKLFVTYFTDLTKKTKERELIYEFDNGQIKCISRQYHSDGHNIDYKHRFTFDIVYDHKIRKISSRFYNKEGIIDVDHTGTFDAIYDEQGKQTKNRIQKELKNVFNENIKIAIKSEDVSNVNKIKKAIQKALNNPSFDLNGLTVKLEGTDKIKIIASKNNILLKGEATVQRIEPLPFLNNVKGYDEVKSELKHIADFVDNYEKYQKIGASVPKGFILHGPPGTGKTYFVKQLTQELGIPFFYGSGPEYISAALGSSAANIRQLFAKARNCKTACIIFIDEIDSLAGKRGSLKEDTGGGKAETQSAVNQFLTELDGFTESPNPIIVVGATNRLESLDEAITRSGRLEKKILIDLPNKKDSELILEMYLKNVKLTPSLKTNDQINTDFLTNFAQKCYESKLSGSDYKRLVNDAALEAVKKDKENVEIKDLETVLEKIQQERAMKIPKPKDLSNKSFSFAQNFLLYSGIILLTMGLIGLIYCRYLRYLRKQKNKILLGDSK